MFYSHLYVQQATPTFHSLAVHEDARKSGTTAFNSTLVQQLSSLAQQQPGCPADAASSLLTLMLAGGQYGDLGDGKPVLDTATTALLFDSLGPQLQVCFSWVEACTV